MSKTIEEIRKEFEEKFPQLTGESTYKVFGTPAQQIFSFFKPYLTDEKKDAEEEDLYSAIAAMRNEKKWTDGDVIEIINELHKDLTRFTKDGFSVLMNYEKKISELKK